MWKTDTQIRSCTIPRFPNSPAFTQLHGCTIPPFANVEFVNSLVYHGKSSQILNDILSVHRIPGFAHGPGEQGIGGVISDKPFVDRIPAQILPQLHGDVAQM